MHLNCQVLLDVDCSSSGGASYSATREWSMERAGPARSGSTSNAMIYYVALAVTALML